MRQRTLPKLLVLAAIVAVSSAILPEKICCAQTITAAEKSSEERLTAEVLQKTLYAKTAEENAYCAFVIAQRDKKVLPNHILYSAYRYSVQKDKDRRFNYFNVSLEKLCKDANIVLKPEPKAKKTATLFSPFRFSGFAWR